MNPVYTDDGSVDGMGRLKERMHAAMSPEDISYILSDYIASGNRKVSKTTAIFNMGSAHDCPNRKTQENGDSDTGRCGVKWEQCYAQKTENMYDQSLAYRRRQEWLWDHLSAEQWAKAFKYLNQRKRNTFTSIRFSESGDFRSNDDIRKVNRIAGMLEIPVYTYSGSHKLDWHIAENFTVNASNDEFEHADRRFEAFETREDIPDDYTVCPNSIQQQNGVSAEDRIKCGDCRVCVVGDSPDVGIMIH